MASLLLRRSSSSRVTSLLSALSGRYFATGGGGKKDTPDADADAGEFDFTVDPLPDPALIRTPLMLPSPGDTTVQDTDILLPDPGLIRNSLMQTPLMLPSPGDTTVQDTDTTLPDPGLIRDLLMLPLPTPGDVDPTPPTSGTDFFVINERFNGKDEYVASFNLTGKDDLKGVIKSLVNEALPVRIPFPNFCKFKSQGRDYLIVSLTNSDFFYSMSMSGTGTGGDGGGSQWVWL